MMGKQREGSPGKHWPHWPHPPRASSGSQDKGPEVLHHQQSGMAPISNTLACFSIQSGSQLGRTRVTAASVSLCVRPLAPLQPTQVHLVVPEAFYELLRMLAKYRPLGATPTNDRRELLTNMPVPSLFR